MDSAAVIADGVRAQQTRRLFIRLAQKRQQVFDRYTAPSDRDDLESLLLLGQLENAV